MVIHVVKVVQATLFAFESRQGGLLSLAHQLSLRQAQLADALLRLTLILLRLLLLLALAAHLDGCVRIIILPPPVVEQCLSAF